MTRKNLACLFLTALIISIGATADCGEKIWLDPANLELPTMGSTGKMTVRIAGVTEVAGVELYITYNPHVVRVVSTPTPGVCPNPEIKIWNDFDNDKGLVRYAVSCLRGMVCDSAAKPNQDTLTIEFERVGAGDANIKFSLSKEDAGISILAGNGVAIFDNTTPANWQHATVSTATGTARKEATN